MFHQNSFPIPRIPSFVLCALLIAATGGLDEAASVGEAEIVEEIDNRMPALKITASQSMDGIEAGSTPSFVCKLSVPGYIWWSTDGRNLTTVGDSEFGERLDIKKASRNDTGDYKCMAQTTDGELLEKEVHIRVVEPARIEPGTPVRVKVMEAANLTCHIHGSPLSKFSWSKGNDSERADHLAKQTIVTRVNDTYSILTLEFKSLARKDNGTYMCKVKDYFDVVAAHRHLFVLDVPKVSIDFMKAVGAGSIFLNWTVDDGNEPVKKYFIGHVKNGSDRYEYYRGKIGEGNTRYVLKGFESGTAYQISIRATNAVGSSHTHFDPRWITTLDEDPVFVPEVSVNGVSDNSITIRWTVPPSHLSEHVHYYNLMAMNENQKREAVCPAQPVTDYVFVNLEPGTFYKFKIAACSEYTRQCGNWSAEVNGSTIDGGIQMRH